MFRFFHGLRGKLTLTYTLVTVLALLAVEVLVLLAAVLLSSLLNNDRRSYLNDVIYTLYPQANKYLQPGSNDLPGLQAWLEGVYSSGYASGRPVNVFDSPAAVIVRSDPLYVLSPQGIVLAQAPRSPNSLVGRRYEPPVFPRSSAILQNAYDRVFDSFQVSALTPQENYLMAVPVTQSDRQSALVGVIILTVKPPPPMLLTIWPVLVGWVLGTGVILLIAVAPFGTLFGFIMSRSLTRRLRALTAAADAWSEGDFQPVPQDRSRDEIGYLGMRMRNMAERVQDLLKTQKARAMMEERTRLARELHDTVKQQAFATLMQVRTARNLLEKEPDAAASQEAARQEAARQEAARQEARRHLEEAEGLIKATQQELGLIIAELRPAVLDERGLAGALQAYLETWSQNAHIPAEFQVRGERGLPITLEQALYRVAQEALANVARHSRASAITVDLAYATGQVCLSVADNGVGFDPQTDGSSGFGMRGMRERLAAFGGTLSIESAPDRGAKVTARVPMK